ncbi:hypothetical protein MLD38_014237 [Melastoma candidum]|uniref:Uncharacterized protein n=1 Tax=Melastoma candidum TaxID=119954 RepID=A0ACB9RC39_9MYRT|nr:hypothetical protein MLD38_014237 [Melastoma candidum]
MGKLKKLKSVLKKLNSFANPRHMIGALPRCCLSHCLRGGRPLYSLLREVMQEIQGRRRGIISMNERFEHLLWMLEDDNASDDRPESVDELVGF